jgi:hypothetical protein
LFSSEGKPLSTTKLKEALSTEDANQVSSFALAVLVLGHSWLHWRHSLSGCGTSSRAAVQIGSWEVEVDESIPPASVHSGACFVAAASLGHQPSTAVPAPVRLPGRPFMGAGAKRPLPAGTHVRTDAAQLPEGALELVPAAVAPSGCAMFVDTFLARKLRPHQVEGVRFLFNVRTHQRPPSLPPTSHQPGSH